MIKSFRHKGLESYFLTGSKAGIQPHHATRLRIQLTNLDSAKQPGDMNVTSWKLHALSGKLAGYWSISVNGNWRVIFRFAAEDVELVDYLDYH